MRFSSMALFQFISFSSLLASLSLAQALHVSLARPILPHRCHEVSQALGRSQTATAVLSDCSAANFPFDSVPPDPAIDDPQWRV